MKKIMLLYILIFSTLFPIDNIEEYKSFVHAKNLYLNGEFEQSKLEFEIYLQSYTDTKLINSHYPDYWIAMNYYKLGESKKALKYFDSSIYLPIHLKYLDSNKTNFFEFERAFYLGEIYTELGYFTNAHYQYLTLIKPYYSQNLGDYEKQALETLASQEFYYNYIIESKYNNNYENIDKLKKDDLVKVRNYLYSKGLFLEFYMAYKNNLEPILQDKEFVIETLSSLQEAGQYDLMIEIIEEQFSFGHRLNEYYYFWGNALKKLEKPFEAIEKYKSVKNKSYLENSIYSIAKIYFVLEDYKNSIIWSKKLNTDAGHELLTKSYLNSDQIDLFKKSAIDYIKQYPNSNLSGYYRNLLYEESQNTNYLKWIVKHNLNSYYYQVAYNITNTTRTLEEYPINYKMRVYKDYLTLLNQLFELGDPQLLIIEADTLDFPEDKVFESYIRTIYLEKIKLYDLALKSSLSKTDDFSKYSNLYPYLYPKYYADIVTKYSRKYDVEEALIFSIIKESSRFNPYLISKSTYFGLMQLNLETANLYHPNITPEQLLNPNINIEIGVKHLADLLSKFDYNISLTIASYYNGKDKIANWKLDQNGDIDVEQIPYLDSQEFIKHVITNYYKYKNLYID